MHRVRRELCGLDRMTSTNATLPLQNRGESVPPDPPGMYFHPNRSYSGVPVLIGRVKPSFPNRVSSGTPNEW